MHALPSVPLAADPEYQLHPYADRSRADGQLNVAATIACTDKHGPGRRFSLWVQECFLRCPGCTNAHMLASEVKNVRTIDDLLAEIRMARESVAKIDGITLQGGEPILQARTLGTLLQRMHAEIDRHLSVLLFTGYTIEYVRGLQLTEINTLLAEVDTVIDGPFHRRELDPTLIRGSMNQRIIHLTDRLRDADFTRRGSEIVFSLGEESLLRTSGLDLSPAEA
jgi:anaerobic ribonucleoside-triphosphate reductase activating protein